MKQHASKKSITLCNNKQIVAFLKLTSMCFTEVINTKICYPITKAKMISMKKMHER